MKQHERKPAQSHYHTRKAGRRSSASFASCTETAGEGGPYGMALLAAYRVEHADGETLANYLQNRVFAGAASTTLNPDAADEAGFAAFLKEYKKALCAERTVVETM